MLNTARNIISSDATTQEMIAPVIDTLVATKAWSVGEEFIYAGTLYKVTTAIAVGDTIVLGSGGNADTADTIVEQIVSMGIELLDETVNNVTNNSNTYINVEGNSSHAYVAFVDIAGYVSVYSILTSTTQIRTVSAIYEDTRNNAPKLTNDGNACKINQVSGTTPRTAYIKYIKFY